MRNAEEPYLYGRSFLSGLPQTDLNANLMSAFVNQLIAASAYNVVIHVLTKH